MLDTTRSLANKLLATVRDGKNNPTAPLWGEVFDIIHRFKSCVSESNPTLYPIHPVGEVRYDRALRRFIVQLPDMNIVLKDHEIVDAIVDQGLFLPHVDHPGLTRVTEL